MDALAPPLKALLYIKLKIQSGLSVRESIREYTQENLHCGFAKDLSLWLFQMEAGAKVNTTAFQKTYRKMLIEILSQGLEGAPILKSLTALEDELVLASKMDMDKQLKKLPLMTLLPLLFLQLPAFLLLVFGPLVMELLDQLDL